MKYFKIIIDFEFKLSGYHGYQICVKINIGINSSDILLKQHGRFTPEDCFNLKLNYFSSIQLVFLLQINFLV